MTAAAHDPKLHAKKPEKADCSKMDHSKMDMKDPNVGTGMVGAPACGDVMKLQIRIEDDIVTDAKFKTYGCGSAIASSSLLTEWVKGKTIHQVEEIKNTEIVEELNLPPVKIQCSVLAEDAIKSAVADYIIKQKTEKEHR